MKNQPERGEGKPGIPFRHKNRKSMENKNPDISTENYKVIDGDITAEQIAGWKAKHGRVIEIEVADTDFEETHRGWFRRPDMRTMQAFSATAKSNEVKAAELIFDNCWLGGSSLMKSDAIYKMQATAKLQDIFGKCVSSLKNL